MSSLGDSQNGKAEIEDPNNPISPKAIMEILSSPQMAEFMKNQNVVKFEEFNLPAINPQH